MSYVAKYHLKNPQKYMGVGTIPIHKSLLEMRVMRFLDLNQKAVRWGYECFKIPYIFRLDHKIHTYFVDFYAEILNNEGKVDKWLMEIKSRGDLSPPKPPVKKTPKSQRNYNLAVMTWTKNIDKWNAAKAMCAKTGMKFKLLSENEIY